MAPLRHETKHVNELDEVCSLRRSQWVLLEERNDDVVEVIEPRDAVPEEILPVVVMPAIDDHRAATEVLHQVLEHVATRCALHYGERRLDLPAELHRVVSLDGNAETAFSIDEPHNPFRGEESFLLIVRTARVVTIRHNAIVTMGCYIELVAADTRIFQHIADCLHIVTDVQGSSSMPASRIPTLGPL